MPVASYYQLLIIPCRALCFSDIILYHFYPNSLCSSCADVFSAPQTHQTYSHLRAFALPATFDWHALPWIHTWLRSLRSWLKLHSLNEAFLNHSVQCGPSSVASILLLSKILLIEGSCVFLLLFPPLECTSCELSSYLSCLFCSLSA